ncbi:MAG TPA: LLM class flavin-dependent oxidoreductase [Amycolatopsis sp.]|jgi:alkanesulfonate monooxygenase SsuD/methylene tetrahydromethanopterin reductase-like flavin-dependent oxidoreductase (luciferase family)/hemerythrin-like domain-containing protein|nr:LLM class flavin-dependent oxidoreductase [Amycolatopsis sp.]
MTDYHHELLFGSFLSPAARRPEQVVALTRLSEAAGLDFATFQDHPYQSSFLDTWTLLSYLAAATSRIRLSANVLNLPLRQPVVLARSAASLDLLSGGRVELGLGAGAFWDGIEAVGGRRLTAGESVDALAEAITIIRAVWDADRRDEIHADGTHYRVRGGGRGPAPAHDMGIWVGAYRPRMLRLAGRVADGTLPSLPYLPDGIAGLAEMNAHIDEGAESAGRDPSAVRRLLNITGEFTATGRGLLTGPPKQWVEELTTIALENGVSGFFLMTDDPEHLQRFGEEVAPAVRELVTTERTGAAARNPRPGTGEDTEAIGAGKGTVHKEAPAKRFSSREVWDPADRPVAPAAPAGHEATARGRAVGRHLVDVHDGLRQELHQLRDLLEQVRQGALSAGQARAAINELTLRQNNWTLGAYCANYCTVLTQHHGIEDQSIFPHLRRSDPGLVPVIDRLEAEHEIIHELIEGLDRALVSFVRDPDDFGGLQEAIDVLTDALLSHLSYEEEQIVEPLTRHGFFPGQL